MAGFAAGINKALGLLQSKIGGITEIALLRYDPTLGFEELLTINSTFFVLEQKEPGLQRLFLIEQDTVTEAVIKRTSHIRYDGKTWVIEGKIAPANLANLWKVDIRFQQTEGS